ncbi:insulin-like 3 (Leydig cell) [Alosa pseudoharengus]|uniref:insulin-like 3 (Leydig cell) n=1 Tax=Alosa pseudoharengus TaxID=34774 RepID=UPI003F8C7C29
MSAKVFLPLLVCVLMGGLGALAQDGRIKLCGREFVRMVISSCGSSRLRRHAPEIDQPHWDFYSDLLDRMSSDQLPTSSNEEVQQQQQQEGTLGLTAHGSPVRDPGSPEGHSASHRIRRDTGPARLCCRSGCTISELVQFC